MAMPHDNLHDDMSIASKRRVFQSMTSKALTLHSRRSRGHRLTIDTTPSLETTG